MKNATTLFLMLFAATSMFAADIPAGYYDNIDGKSDATLKSALSLIIRGGTRYVYGVTQYHSRDDQDHNPPEYHAGDLKAYGTWQALPLTDMHPDGVVWDMYSNCQRYFPKKLGDSGCSLNIEHCLPKSWWGGTDNEAYKDLYNLNPSDQRANSLKSNYAPGHVSNADKFDNGSFRIASASKSTYGYICWEPAPEYRGDFARTYFYMATAYEYLEWTAYTQYISTSSYLMFSDDIIGVLLDWHRSDPVSDKEICRANAISDIQGNRNAFIDYPDLVEYIWGNKKGQSVNLATLTCTAGTGVCPQPEVPVDPHIYDTIINLPAITAAYINAVQGQITGSASSSTIRSNGNASITMGNGSSDGEFSFSGISLTDTAVLVFRASPYNSATSMQLEIYVNGGTTPVRTITETVVQDTRNEVTYRTKLEQNTTSIRIKSVGGATTKRACMQELYVLVPKALTGIEEAREQRESSASKELKEGALVIKHRGKEYSVLGQRK
jgi:hypothetical protein